MRGLRVSRRGLSEIVGALMLVLIVVSAATVFAIFASAYQRQLEQQQAAAQERSLESLGILRAAPTLSTTSTSQWSTVNFTLASLYINPMIIAEITINGNPLRQYSAFALNLTSGQFQSVTVGAGGQLSLAPREQVNVIVNCTIGSPDYSFYNSSGFFLPTTTYVKVEVFTALQNIFTRVFIPPTAIAVVGSIETQNSGGFTQVPLLDGSQSFQPVNGTLVAWSWSIFPDNTTASGEKAVVSFNPIYTVHHITLTVTNSDGFLGIDEVDYS